MKDIFDKVTQSTKDISKGLVDQTKTTVTQGKIELDLLQAKSNLSKLYTDLGEKVYENRLHPEANPEIEILYGQLAQKNKELKALEKAAKDLRTEQKSSFESIKRDVKKTWTGEGQETKRPEADEAGNIKMKFCDNCNIGNHPDAEYCIACGYKQ